MRHYTEVLMSRIGFFSMFQGKNIQSSLSHEETVKNELQLG